MDNNITITERVVWTLAAIAGLSDKEIGDKIHRSIFTVKNHKRALYEKLHITKNTELVREWFIQRYGLCRTELEATIKNPNLWGVVFFIGISLYQIVSETPLLRVRAARSARVRARGARGRRSRDGEGDYLVDPEELYPTLLSA